MNIKVAIMFLAMTTVCPSALVAGVALGEKPPIIELSGDAGGKVDGSPWSSASLSGKIHALFYVDPDEKDLNENLAEALHKADFPLDKFGSIAVINMDATWLPNFAIESSLKEKQKKYTKTTYVKDFDKLLVKKWGLTDDTYDCLIFDKDGQVLFSKAGKLSDKEVKTFVDLISKKINQKVP